MNPMLGFKAMFFCLTDDIRFDYLLVNSWFTYSELLKFVISRHFGCHLMGIIKMSKTMYETVLGNKTTPEIIKALYKTFGGLFAEISNNSVELSVAEKSGC